jgi:hypothetical protein
MEQTTQQMFACWPQPKPAEKKNEREPKRNESQAEIRFRRNENQSSEDEFPRLPD